MVVQKRSNETRFFGAIQFDEKRAEKSLAMYPGVESTSLSALFDKERDKEWTSLYLEGIAWRRNVYALNGYVVNDGDWLVTDMDGKTYVYTDVQFKELFVGKDGEDL